MAGGMLRMVVVIVVVVEVLTLAAAAGAGMWSVFNSSWGLRRQEEASRLLFPTLVANLKEACTHCYKRSCKTRDLSLLILLDGGGADPRRETQLDRRRGSKMEGCSWSAFKFKFKFQFQYNSYCKIKFKFAKRVQDGRMQLVGLSFLFQFGSDGTGHFYQRMRYLERLTVAPRRRGFDRGPLW